MENGRIMENREDLEKLIFFCSQSYAYFLLLTLLKKFDFFNRLGDKEFSIQELMEKFKIKERPMIVVLQLLWSLNCIAKSKSNKYSLSGFSKKYLLNKSEEDLTGFILMRYFNVKIERDLVELIYGVLKTGKPVSWGNSSWKDSVKSDEVAKNFKKAMDSRGKQFTKVVAKEVNLSSYNKLLDLGGNSGVYSKELIRKNTNLSAVVFDLSSTVNEDMSNGRLSFIGGDFFKDNFPKGCDVVLLSNVLHDWDIKRNSYLINKVYNYLPKGGLLMIHDGHIKKDDLRLTEHSVILMLFTNGRFYYQEEMFGLLKKAGFVNIRIKEIPFKRSIILANKK